MTRRTVLRAVIAERRLRSLIGAFGLFSLTEYATWLAITVWAFQRGGITEAGIAGFVQLVPAALVAPLAAYAGDRFRRDHVLACGLALVGLFAVLTGVAMATGAPAWVVYLAGAAAASAMTIARPAMGSILPGVTDTPEAMTAANVAVEVVDATAVFAGPAGAGLLLAWTSPSVVFVAFGVASAIGAGLILSTPFDPNRVRPTGTVGTGQVHAEMRAGFATLRNDPPTAAALTLVMTGFAVAGAVDVLFVVVAFDLLDAGEGMAGTLAAVAGIGGLVGATASMTLVGRRHLRASMVLAALAGGLPILGLIDVSSAVLASVCLLVAGGGWSMLNVAGRTLIQRSTADDVLARVLGVLEGATTIGTAIGALAVGLVAEWLGLAWAIAGTGALMPLAALAAWRLLGDADRRAVAVDPALIDLVRNCDFLAPLGPPVISQLALNLRPVRVQPGEALIRQGERGDRFYLIADGGLEVTRDGEVLARRGPGEYVGEIALVFEVPRTADVTAVEPTLVYRLGREVFTAALTGHPTARTRAVAVANERSTDPE
ncbi:MAG: MFS transporter [Acidimicrobiales bacterium]